MIALIICQTTVITRLKKGSFYTGKNAKSVIVFILGDNGHHNGVSDKHIGGI